jgi:hypothetical protein
MFRRSAAGDRSDQLQDRGQPIRGRGVAGAGVTVYLRMAPRAHGLAVAAVLTGTFSPLDAVGTLLCQLSIQTVYRRHRNFPHLAVWQ